MKKVWMLLLFLCACVLCAACSNAQPQETTAPQEAAPQLPVLYYNLDGSIYQDPNNMSISNRQPGEGGAYKIAFATGGKTVTYTTNDAQMVNWVDSMQVMLLTTTEDGKIEKADPAPEPLVYRDVVQQIKDGVLVMNSSVAYNGKQYELPLSKDCRFYDLGNGGALTQPEIMDELLVYGTEKGQATDVFILRREPQTKLYWRLNRKYDAKSHTTTRQTNENGEFVIPFVCEGQQLELKCKDWAVMAEIEAPESGNAAMGLFLDEAGYITRMLPAYRGLRGREICNQYDVVAMEGNKITVQNKQVNGVFGRVCHITMGEDCKIYDISSGAVNIGQPLEGLQIGDRVTVYADSMGIATNVYVHVRLLDSPVYYNMVRKYSASKTTRVPDGEGWYVFDMVCDGQLVQLKTKDEAIASKVDSFSSKVMGMKRNGDVIEQVFDVSCVTGEYELAVGRYVFSSTEAMIVTCNENYKGLKALMLHTDCKIYDVSGNPGTVPGTETTLQKGDRFTAVGTPDGEATVVLVLNRSY